MGIATSLVNLMLMPIIGINSGIQPIIGYNYGARLYGRARDTLKTSTIATCAICTAAYVLFWAFSRQVMGLFVKDAPDVIAMGVTGLRIYLSSMPVLAIVMLGSGYFQAVKKPAQAFIPNMIRQIALLVPLYLLLPRYFGLTGVWMAGPLTDAASVLITLVLLIPEMRRLSVEAKLAAVDSGLAVGVAAAS